MAPEHPPTIPVVKLASRNGQQRKLLNHAVLQATLAGIHSSISGAMGQSTTMEVLIDVEAAPEVHRS